LNFTHLIVPVMSAARPLFPESGSPSAILLCRKSANSGLMQCGKKVRSLDHLVGDGEQRWRHGEAEGFGGLEIDDQLKFRRLLDR
jgi:hypothetical protein